jgi:hypothetical protein
MDRNKRQFARLGSFLSLGFVLLTNLDRIAKFFGIINIPKDVREAMVAFAQVPTLLSWIILAVGLGCIWFLYADHATSAFKRARGWVTTFRAQRRLSHDAPGQSAAVPPASVPPSPILAGPTRGERKQIPSPARWIN